MLGKKEFGIKRLAVHKDFPSEGQGRGYGFEEEVVVVVVVEVEGGGWRDEGGTKGIRMGGNVAKIEGDTD